MAKIRVHNLFQQNGSKNKIYMFLNKFFIYALTLIYHKKISKQVNVSQDRSAF